MQTLSFFIALHPDNESMKHRAFIILLLFVITMAHFSCSSGACVDETVPSVKAVIYSSSTGKIIKCDSIIVTAPAVNGDTILAKEKSVSEFIFTLDPSGTASKMVFKLNNIKDTVTITYTTSPYFVSDACGYTFCHSITGISYTDNIIDSIKLADKSVTTNVKSNLRLYY